MDSTPPSESAGAVPPMLPPVVTPPRARKPPRPGRGWMICSIILAGLLMFSLLGYVVEAFQTSDGQSHAVNADGHRLEEIILKVSKSDNKIAVLEVEGIITSLAFDGSGRTMVDLLKDELAVAAKDDDVKAVILKVDSPGGEVLASDQIYRALEKFQSDSGKPVIASMLGLAASGGYYVSAPCRWIVADELTLTGSIGVIMHGYNYRGLLNKVGVKPEVFKSGKYKDMMSGDREPSEVSPEERKMLQELIDETFLRFKTVVSVGRSKAASKNKGASKPLVANWEDYADGRVLSGRQAFEHGFVDQLGDFDAAVKKARELAGISEAKLVRYERHFDLSNLFRLFGKKPDNALKIDLGVDLPKLQAGRLYFLPAALFH